MHRDKPDSLSKMIIVAAAGRDHDIAHSACQPESRAMAAVAPVRPAAADAAPPTTAAAAVPCHR